MDYDDWMDMTRRGLLTPRSTALKALDALVNTCYPAPKSGAKAGGTTDKIKLANALEGWMKSKQDWRNSARNKTKANGKGAVELLLEQMGKDPTVGARFRAYLNAPPPPPVAHGNGVVKIQKDLDSEFFELKVQAEENSCGPACIRIVAKLVSNADIGEDYLRQLVEMAEEGASYQGGLGDTGVVQSTGVHDWGANGGGTWLVPAALGSLRPAIKASHSTSVAQLLQTSKHKPAIGVVAWDGGGLHYVVVCGKYKKDPTKMRVIDPFYGVQTVPVALGGLGKYKPKHPDTGAATNEATWYPWVCRVV